MESQCPCYTCVDGDVDPACPLHGNSIPMTTENQNQPTVSEKSLLEILDEIEKRASAATPGPQAHWNGEPSMARTGTVIVGASPRSTWWCAKLEGQRIKCVRVEHDGEVFFLRDDDDSGSHKVFETKGGPFCAPHSSIPVPDPATFVTDLLPPADPEKLALVKALRRAIQPLTEVAQTTVMTSQDAGDCIVDHHKDDSAEALVEIEKLLREPADSVEEIK